VEWAGSWPHLEVAAATAGVLERLARGGFVETVRAGREWARARHLDLGAQLLTPALVESVEELLAGAWSEPEGVPLAEVGGLAEPHLDGRNLVVVLVDALRWDLWDLLRPQVEEVLGAPVAEALALAPTPTVTAVGRGAVLTFGKGDTPPGFAGRL